MMAYNPCERQHCIGHTVRKDFYIKHRNISVHCRIKSSLSKITEITESTRFDFLTMKSVSVCLNNLK